MSKPEMPKNEGDGKKLLAEANGASSQRFTLSIFAVVTLMLLAAATAVFPIVSLVTGGIKCHTALVVDEIIDDCVLSMNSSCVSEIAPSKLTPVVLANPPPSVSPSVSPSASSPPPKPPSPSPPPSPVAVSPPPSPTPPVCVVVDDEDGLPTFMSNAPTAVPGAKPYFEGWHGETSSKSFVHDHHADKGLKYATYKPTLPAAGCYAVQEWHPTGGFYCLKYMPVNVPLKITHKHGVAIQHIDQHVHGGQWNTVGQYDFDAGTAEMTLSNNGTIGCEYGAPMFGANQMCYWTADAMRLVRVADSCAAAPPTDAALEATCTAAASAPAPLLPTAPLTLPDSVPAGRTLTVQLAHTHLVSEGACVMTVRASGFPAGTSLHVHLSHLTAVATNGEQLIYQLSTISLGVYGGGDFNVTMVMPNLHQLVEHCTTCTPHAGAFALRVSDALLGGAVVHSHALSMAWHA